MEAYVGIVFLSSLVYMAGVLTWVIYYRSAIMLAKTTLAIIGADNIDVLTQIKWWSTGLTIAVGIMLTVLSVLAMYRKKVRDHYVQAYEPYRTSSSFLTASSVATAITWFLALAWVVLIGVFCTFAFTARMVSEDSARARDAEQVYADNKHAVMEGIATVAIELLPKLSPEQDKQVMTILGLATEQLGMNKQKLSNGKDLPGSVLATCPSQCLDLSSHSWMRNQAEMCICDITKLAAVAHESYFAYQALIRALIGMFLILAAVSLMTHAMVSGAQAGKHAGTTCRQAGIAVGRATCQRLYIARCTACCLLQIHKCIAACCIARHAIVSNPTTQRLHKPSRPLYTPHPHASKPSAD
jgi:hypothetical protein